MVSSCPDLDLEFKRANVQNPRGNTLVESAQNMRKQFTIHRVSVANNTHECLVAKGCKALIETGNNFRQSIMCQ